MKKFSKVKYFGAVAAALLAVAPIAAPVVSQVASPAIAEAATPGNEALSPTQADAISNQLNTDVKSFTLSNKDASQSYALWEKWVPGKPQNITNTSNMPSAAEWLTSGNPFINAVPSSTVVYHPQGINGGSTNTYLSYTVSGGYGNQLSASSQTQQILSNLQVATIAQNDSTYNITVTAYDSRTQQPLKGSNGATVQKSYSVTIKGTHTATATATGSFKPVTVKVGDQFPGLFADPTNAAGDISLTVNGKNITLNKAQDVAALGYATKQPASVGEVQSAITNWPNIKSALAGYVDKDGNWTGNGVAYQVAQLAANNSDIQGLKESLTGTTSGLIGGDLWWDNTTKNLYLVRPITISDSDYNTSLPTIFYQYQQTPAKPVQYWDGSTVYLTTDDDATLNKSGKLTTVQDVVDALSKVVLGTNTKLTAKQSTDDPTKIATDAQWPAGVAPTATDFENAVKSAAAAAGVSISSKTNKFSKTANVLIPVTYKNKANLSITVKVPVTLDGTTQGTPVFTFAQGWVQNPTVQVGQQFKATEGISAWTDQTLATGIDAVNWKIDGSVDTSKPGSYDLTYTITNPTTGKTAQLKRTVKVIASEKTSFENINSVIYVQTSKSPQYKYDSKTDSFTKDSSVAALPLSSGWKTTKKATASDGTVYYIVGGNGYLKASDVTTAKVTKTAGVVTVTNPEGTYTNSNTTANSGKVQYLANNSAWKYFAIATNPDGSRAYLVADNQWVPASDVVERVNSASGTFTVGSDAAPVFNGAGNVLKGQTLKTRSSWKVTGVKNINGKPYYRVSTDGYVRADYGSYKA